MDTTENYYRNMIAQYERQILANQKRILQLQETVRARQQYNTSLIPNSSPNDMGRRYGVNYQGSVPATRYKVTKDSSGELSLIMHLEKENVRLNGLKYQYESRLRLYRAQR